MATYQEWQTTGTADTPGLSPPRLRGRFGSALMHVFGSVKDVIVSAAKEAVKARLVETAPDDALPFIGSERMIERYPGESTASFRERLRVAWDTWLFAGTSRGVVAALTAAGFTASAYDVRTAPPWWVGTWPPNGPDAMPFETWARFWIVLEPPFPFAWTLSVWGSGTWGSGGTWGSTATSEQVSLVRRIIRKWKAAHERCAQILVRMPDGLGGFVTLSWRGEE